MNDANKITLSESGFEYYTDFVDDPESLIKNINAETWDKSLSRNTQHYNSRYVYVNAKRIDHFYNVKKVANVPWLESLVQKIKSFMESRNTPIYLQWDDSDKLQVIINEYRPNLDGIAHHIDDIGQFGNYIIGISLNDDIIMNFLGKNGQSIDFKIEKNSLYILKDDIRYKFRHGIDKKNINKEKRISITFRFRK